MENNGRGIFYGVIGVATLVVAIIGATFAYFSATATGTAFDTEAAQVGVTFKETNYMKTDLIPVEAGLSTGVGQKLNDDGKTYSDFEIADQKTLEGQTGFVASEAAALFANSNEVGPNACKSGQYNICSIYDFTVTNEGSVEMPVNILFTPTTSDKSEDKKIPNLKYAIFKGTADKVTSWAVTGEPVAAATATDGQLVVAARDAYKALNGELDVTVPGSNGTVSYSIIVWIEEVGMKQSAKGDFNGTVSVITGNGQGITGQLTQKQPSA